MNIDLKDYSKYVVNEGVRHFDINYKVLRFENDYSASIINGGSSYTGGSDEFEVAVIRFTNEDNDDYRLVYNTEITDDVLSYLSNDEVLDVLKDIKELSKKTN